MKAVANESINKTYNNIMKIPSTIVINMILIVCNQQKQKKNKHSPLLLCYINKTDKKEQIYCN